MTSVIEYTITEEEFNEHEIECGFCNRKIKIDSLKNHILLNHLR